MSTNATIRIYDEDFDSSELVATIYKHWDGDSVGEEIKASIGHKIITRGIGSDSAGTANGAGCLAAQLVKDLKQSVGDVYLSAPRDRGSDPFDYDIYAKPGELRIVVRSMSTTIYDGPVAEYQP